MNSYSVAFLFGSLRQSKKRVKKKLKNVKKAQEGEGIAFLSFIFSS